MDDDGEAMVRRIERKEDRRLYVLVLAAVFMSAGHHLDHIVRGNHVGWPITDQVNPFTYSLAIYPVVLLGLGLYRAGTVGPGFWALLSGTGVLFLVVVHFSPLATEPLRDIINLYEPRIVGWLAFAWLVLFVLVLLGTCVYESVLWARTRRRAPGRA